VAYRFAANQTICVSPWIQKSRRIHFRPRTGPQSAYIWWPAVAKLQAASAPIAMGQAGGYAPPRAGRNNDNSHDNVYGAVIMTKVIARVRPVHLKNPD